MAKGYGGQQMAPFDSDGIERTIFTPNINVKRQCMSDYNVASETGVSNLHKNVVHGFPNSKKLNQPVKAVQLNKVESTESNKLSTQPNTLPANSTSAKLKIKKKMATEDPLPSMDQFKDA